MDQVLNAIIPEDSAPGRLKQQLSSKLSLAMRRTHYDRLPANGEGQSSLEIEVPNGDDKGHPGRTPRPGFFNLGLTPRPGSDIESLGGAADEVPRTPSMWGKVKDAYEDMMLKTAENASSVSVVPVARKLDRSLTLGSGFGTKVEVIPTETNLGFKLTKAEEQYLEHLRKRYDSRYA
ncbi:unnamed protein product [Calypogeia fissa]